MSIKKSDMKTNIKLAEQETESTCGTDGMSRRTFMRAAAASVGMLAAGGVSLPAGAAKPGTNVTRNPLKIPPAASPA